MRIIHVEVVERARHRAVFFSVDLADERRHRVRNVADHAVFRRIQAADNHWADDVGRPVSGQISRNQHAVVFEYVVERVSSTFSLECVCGLPRLPRQTLRSAAREQRRGCVVCVRVESAELFAFAFSVVSVCADSAEGAESAALSCATASLGSNVHAQISMTTAATANIPLSKTVFTETVAVRRRERPLRACADMICLPFLSMC